MAAVTAGINNVVYTHAFESSVGTLHCGVDKLGRVLYVGYAPLPPRSLDLPVQENKYACGEVEYQLDRYLAGELTTFTVELRLEGTGFQKAVWSRLLKIPYGTTMTYGDVAQKIGRKDAARAVGNAVAANPVAIIVPCHRVVPQSGGVGHYSAGDSDGDTGAATKRRLIELEQRSTFSPASASAE